MCRREHLHLRRPPVASTTSLRLTAIISSATLPPCSSSVRQNLNPILPGRHVVPRAAADAQVQLAFHARRALVLLADLELLAALTDAAQEQAGRLLVAADAPLAAAVWRGAVGAALAADRVQV